MMWSLTRTVGRRTPHDVGVNPDWSVVTVGEFRLWHGQGPAQQVHRADVPGCRLLIVGCCTTPQSELPGIAQRLARGDTAALAALDGSRVVIAVRSHDLLVAGDLAGQHPVFYTSSSDVAVSSHAGQLAGLAGRSVNRQWLAARMLLPACSRRTSTTV